MFHVAQQGAVKVVGGDAPLSGENVAAAAAVCDALWRLGQPRIVFDLSKIPLIDSAGLEFLLDLRDRCSERGGLLALASAGPLIGEIFSATGLTHALAWFDDPVAAAGSFAQ